MKVTEVAAPDFDLAKTLNSGQVFHWDTIDNGFAGAIGERAVWVEQRGNSLCARLEERAPASPASSVRQINGPASQELRPPIADVITHYFALDHPLAQICASFPNDEAMDAAKEFCRGLRIIRQPKWECLAMFICSSMKQVAHIRQIARKLRERFGAARELELPRRDLKGRSAAAARDASGRGRAASNHTIVFAFPSAERIAQSSEAELRECALGYRAKNLLATAGLISDGAVNLESLGNLPDNELRDVLGRLPGVGAKVANCVMLFAYERLRAFPIDVWIERVLKERYFARKQNVTAERLREFSESYFGAHGGYAQQYLFHYARMSKGTAVALRRPSLGPRKKLRGVIAPPTGEGGRGGP